MMLEIHHAKLGLKSLMLIDIPQVQPYFEEWKEKKSTALFQNDAHNGLQQSKQAIAKKKDSMILGTSLLKVRLDYMETQFINRNSSIVLVWHCSYWTNGILIKKKRFTKLHTTPSAEKNSNFQQPPKKTYDDPIQLLGKKIHK